jgi:hypothetical protein
MSGLSGTKQACQALRWEKTGEADRARSPFRFDALVQALLSKICCVRASPNVIMREGDAHDPCFT